MKYSYKGRDTSEFNLTDVSELRYKSPEKRDNLYKIIWAMNDDVNLGIDGYRVSLQKHHLLFTTPLNKLDLTIENTDVVVYTFNREFYCIRDHDTEVSCNGFLFLGSSSPIVVALNEKEQKSFNLLYQFFVEEFETTDHIQGEMLLVLLKRLLIKSVRIARKTLPVEDMPQTKLNTIRKFNLLVEMHFREKHMVSEYADMLNMTPKSLSNLFSRYFNKSPLKVISERIILESKRLLDFSDKDINEIAYTVGFDEISHFSKFFKTHAGVSPSQYKNNS
jgi:AraC-like DNA-binding protein